MVELSGTVPYFALGAGILALLFSLVVTRWILSQSAGNDRMKEISNHVREGAMAFMRVEYGVVAVFTIILIVLFLVVGVVTGDDFWYFTAAGFAAGALLSAAAGFAGMAIAVRSNARVAEAARTSLDGALRIAARAGAVNGFVVVGLGLAGVAAFYIAYRALIPDVQDVPLNLIGFAFGASLITLFARIAGGIYTKAADVGADLVGKVEAGIPEDDPRNPAVVADNVGDNVGDCAGMGADLFETYVVTIIASMALAATAGIYAGANALGEAGILYPLALGAFSILSGIIGILFIKLPASGNIMSALYRGVFATVIVSAVGFWAITVPLFGFPLEFFLASLVGLALVLVLVFVTDYYTSTKYRPVKEVASASQTGAATNIIQGLAVGLESTFLPVVFIVIGLITSFLLGDAVGDGLGIYGIAVAATSMLSVAGMIVTLDTYGPITDNAGGIAEMAELPPEVRTNTDALDAVGNTTKATTKGYAIGSAALAALVLFADYVDHAAESAALPPDQELVFGLQDPYVLVGLLLGAAVVFLFGAYLMRAVGRAAKSVIEEVRRQFADGKIMAGERKPEYGTAVAIVTRAALKEMVIPGSMAVVAPLAVGFLFGPLALGGFLIGIIVAGLVTALLMANGGGTWDNAKKYVEDGHYGGKGSEAHAAAVVGDTVGDPFKDTAGPAINPLIKAINTIAVIFAALVVNWSLLGGL